ncbi:MAG: thioredoxin [Candidatus Omnitrophica bacterium]|jgi:thioredoxin 1|nr:thioredoxin [Candidatus Omnitrophota bacterium]
MSLLHFTDASFKKEVLEAATPVLVDFWAPWCGPCKMIAPVLEELAKEYIHKIKIGKINIDEDSKTATHFGVMSIPTLIFFKKGKAIDQIVGALSKAELKKKIEENLQ